MFLNTMLISVVIALRPPDYGCSENQNTKNGRSVTRAPSCCSLQTVRTPLVERRCNCLTKNHFRAAGAGKTKLMYDFEFTPNNQLTSRPAPQSSIIYQMNCKVHLHIFTARGAPESLDWGLLMKLSAAFFDNFRPQLLEDPFRSLYKRNTRNFRMKDSS